MAVIAVIAVPVVPAFAATTADVTVTATPTYIALTNDTGNWTIGTVVENTDSYYFTADSLVPAEPLVDGDMKGTITNTGSVAEDIDIKIAAFTGGVGWTISLDQTPGVNEVSVRAGITGMANRAAMVQVITTDTELKDTLAASGTIMWCAELETGTFTDGVAKSSTMTLTASAAN
jgi:hypothetical protein